MKRLLTIFALALIGLSAHAGEKDQEWKQTPFGERGVYMLESQFSYLSQWGPTDLRDRITTANGGSVSLDDAFLRVDSGTNADASADLETVERVIYEAGRQLEAAIKVGVVDEPVNGAIAEWGLGTDDNGAYFRLDDGTFSVVYEHDGTEIETTRADFRGDAASCQDFDPVEDPGVYLLRFNWYGAGGAAYYVYYPQDEAKDTLTECLLHYEAPDNDGESWTNPNLPIFARVDNTAATDDDQVILDVGGRRAGAQGSYKISDRYTGDYRIGQSVAAADGLVPLICAKRESDFPTANDLNSVPMRVSGMALITDQDAVGYIVIDPDLTGASFGTPTNHQDDETALVIDTSATALSSPLQVSGPYLFQGGGSGNSSADTLGSKDITIPFVGEDPVCLAADVDTDASITSALRVVEGW